MMKSMSFAVLVLVFFSAATPAQTPPVCPEELKRFSVELAPREEYEFIRSDWVDGEETLRWDLEPDRGFSISGTYSYGCAQRYTETTGVRVKAILYYLTGSADAIFVYTAGAGSHTEPGPTLDTTRATGLGGGVWRRANMPRTPYIAPYQDFWACVIVRRHPPDQKPLTLDLGPIVPYRGGYITLPDMGPNWFQLTDPPFWTDRNVCIRAVIERVNTGVEEVISPSEPSPWHRLKPSPAHGQLTINFRVMQPGPVNLGIYDATGRLIKLLREGHAQPGEYSVLWDCHMDNGKKVKPGTYLYRLTANNHTVTGKVVVMD